MYAVLNNIMGRCGYLHTKNLMEDGIIQAWKVTKGIKQKNTYYISVVFTAARVSTSTRNPVERKGID